MANLEVETELGRGTFGVVNLVRHKHTNHRFALKMIWDTPYTVQEEIMCHQLLRKSDFTTTLHLVMQEETHTSLLMEYASGGTLLDLLQEKGMLCEQAAKFYATNIILALLDLKHQNILHRDLKPANLLIDHEGYLKVSILICIHKVICSCV